MTILEKTLFDFFRDELRKIILEHYSTDGKIDPFWESELPIMDTLLDFVLWLRWRRRYCTDEILDVAAKLALRRKMPDISKVPTARLFPAYWVRHAILEGIWECPGLNEAVDQCSPQWVYIPYSTPECVLTAAYVQWQGDFMICYNEEIVRRIKRSDWNVNMFRLIELGRADANQWLLNQSHSRARGILHEDRPEVGEDALQDWSAKLLSKPFHVRLQKYSVTRKAIHDGIIDSQRKGGRYGHIPIDETIEDLISDESQERPDELQELLSTEMGQQIMKQRPQIEAALSEDVKRDREQVGARRFIVLLESDKTSEQLAAGLGVNEKTVDRDRAVIHEKREIIQKMIWD